MEGRFIGFASLFTRRRRERGREGGSVILNFLFTSRDENNRSRSGLVRIMHRGAAAATEDGDKIYRKVARHCSLALVQDGQGWYAESK